MDMYEKRLARIKANRGEEIADAERMASETFVSVGHLDPDADTAAIAADLPALYRLLAAALRLEEDDAVFYLESAVECLYGDWVSKSDFEANKAA